jgi:hypothetical protein
MSMSLAGGDEWEDRRALVFLDRISISSTPPHVRPLMRLRRARGGLVWIGHACQYQRRTNTGIWAASLGGGREDNTTQLKRTRRKCSTNKRADERILRLVLSPPTTKPLEGESRRGGHQDWNGSRSASSDPNLQLENVQNHHENLELSHFSEKKTGNAGSARFRGYECDFVCAPPTFVPAGNPKAHRDPHP